MGEVGEGRGRRVAAIRRHYLRFSAAGSVEWVEIALWFRVWSGISCMRAGKQSLYYFFSLAASNPQSSVLPVCSAQRTQIEYHPFFSHPFPPSPLLHTPFQFCLNIHALNNIITSSSLARSLTLDSSAALDTYKYEALDGVVRLYSVARSCVCCPPAMLSSSTLASALYLGCCTL